MLEQSRRTSAGLVLGSGVFVAAGLWMVFSPASFDRSVEYTLFWGWFSVIFFGATGLVGLSSLVRPTQLILSREGFQIHGLRLKPLVRWNEVECFFVSKLKRTKFVSFTLKASTHSPVRRAAALIGSTSRVDGRIPAYLEKGAEEVRALLEEWRTQYSVAD
ncbi:hypothetical protein D3C85_751190 [compost metagenome]